MADVCVHGVLMPHVQRPGFDLHYAATGDRGPRVLLIMGLAAPGRCWRGVVPLLQRDHQLAWFDHRGLGDTGTPPGPYSMADFADDAVAVLDGLGWPDAHVVGMSMGGMVAQHVALRSRGRVRSLALLATHAGGLRARIPGPLGIRRFLATQLYRNEESRLDALAKLLFSPSFLAQTPVATLRTHLREDFGQPPPLAVLLSQLAAVQGHNTAAQLPSLVDLPALVVRPDLDILIHPRESDRLARLLPRARLAAVADCGHAVTRQAPGQVAELLRGHFAQADAAADADAAP